MTSRSMTVDTATAILNLDCDAIDRLGGHAELCSDYDGSVTLAISAPDERTLRTIMRQVARDLHRS